jgi:hypothetical protein
MMIGCAASTGLSSCDECVRVTAASSGERPGQGRGILALRHQLMVLERQLGKARPRFSPVDRAFLAALLHRLPRDMLGRFRLLIRPETVLRWHRDLLARRHASSSRPGRPAVRAPSAPSAGWCCAWHRRTRAGATAASTANSSFSGSRPQSYRVE